MAKKKTGKKKRRGREPIYKDGKKYSDYFKTVFVHNLTKRIMNKIKRKGETYADQISLSFDVVEFVGRNQLGMKDEYIHPGDVLNTLHTNERKKRIKEDKGR